EHRPVCLHHWLRHLPRTAPDLGVAHGHLVQPRRVLRRHYFTSDGQALWAADRTHGGAAKLDRSGTVLTEVPINAGVDGIAVALGTASGCVANNVFVNDNNGKIYRIDTNNGNALSVVAKGGTRGDF